MDHGSVMNVKDVQDVDDVENVKERQNGRIE